MTETWTAEVTVDDWSANVTEEVWECDQVPGTEFRTIVSRPTIESGGGSTFMGYVNAFSQVTPETYDATYAAVLATPSALGPLDRFRLYLYDGDTEAAMFVGHGLGEVATLDDQQPFVGAVYSSHYYTNNGGASSALGQRIWEVRPDQGVGDPHPVVIVGETRQVTDTAFTLAHFDTAVINLTDDVTLGLPDPGLGDQPSSIITFLVQDLDGHTATLAAAIEGVTNLTVGNWIAQSTNSEWVWIEQPGGGGGSGDVVGPASATDSRPALFDGTTGKLLKQASAALGTAAFTASSDYATAAQGATADAAVPKALYDAHTILTAVSDNTPAALTVAEQTLVGRIAGGNIDDLSASDVRTLLALVVGTNVQAWDADLDSIAALTTTSFGRSRLTETSGWQVISDTTVSAAGAGVASIDVSCSGYRFLRVDFKGRSLRSAVNTDTLTVRFNSDSGSTYSVNAGSLTTGFNASGAIASSKTNTDRMGHLMMTVAVGSSTYTTMLARTESPTSEGTLSVNADERSGIWNGSVGAALTSMQVFFGAGNIADGSVLIVEGLA